MDSYTIFDMGVSQNWGYLFCGPYNKDYSIWGSILGYPNFGKLPHASLHKGHMATVQDNVTRMNVPMLFTLESLDGTLVPEGLETYVCPFGLGA